MVGDWWKGFGFERGVTSIEDEEPYFSSGRSDLSTSVTA